ncbi:MAG: YlbF family regulator [Clostridia bacterium]|nr:YlbF family regulator [Clostridia bacterium]
MDLEKMARELGAAIQKDERYLNYVKARETNEADTELNDLIGKIQLIHSSYQHEAAKGDEANSQKLDAYDKEFNEVYTQVMSNKNMQAFEKARQEVDEMMKYLTGILTLCVCGEDPETCDPNAHAGCNGNCSSCSSDCH